MQVPLLDLKTQYSELKDEIMNAVNELADTQMFILGGSVERFEKEIAEYCDTGYACGVSSGSDALIISLMVEGIGPGDEVITTPFTFFATAGAIARLGAKPVFADISEEDFNIDAESAAEKITPKTKAIIPVHLFGQVADMGRIMAIAEAEDLVVIEDACQAIGSEYEGSRAGSIGHYGCFSFFPSKNLGCFGDGGVVTVNNASRLEMLKIFRNHGSNPKYYHKYIGGNFRLDALQAVVLSIKLKQLDSWSKARQKNAAEYRSLFARAGLDDKVSLPVKSEHCTRHIYNQFTIRVHGQKRDKLKKALADAGIGSDIYYPVPLHLQECFSSLGYRKGDFPVSEKACEEVLSLPIYPESTREQRQYVVDTVRETLS